jgi:hypothetical protein
MNTSADTTKPSATDIYALGRDPGESALCYPAHPAYTRMWELFRAAFGRNGADLLIGRRLAELYRRAGLQEIGIEARAECASPATPAGPSVLTWYAAFTP